jgi:hypothetical protein
MQLYGYVPGWLSLCHRATRVWVDTLAYGVAICDVSTRIARRLATRWYRVHNSHFRDP